MRTGVDAVEGLGHTTFRWERQGCRRGKRREGGWACNLSICLLKNPIAEIRWDFEGELLVGTS